MTMTLSTYSQYPVAAATTCCSRYGGSTIVQKFLGFIRESAADTNYYASTSTNLKMIFFHVLEDIVIGVKQQEGVLVESHNSADSKVLCGSRDVRSPNTARCEI